MKKTLIVFCVILAVVPILLSYLGLKDSYLTERRFWKARALSQKIVANPDATPPLMFEKARNNFQRIIKDNPKNTGLAKECKISIAGLLVYEKKFQDARDYLEKAKADYPADKAFAARTLFLTGFSYEREGRWDRALESYHLLMNEYYTVSHIALQLPLYIARHDLKLDTQKGEESYREAATYYRQLIRKHPNDALLGFYVRSYLVKGFQEQKKWEESLEVIREIILAYPKALRPYIPVIEAISRRTGQLEKAVAIYHAFIQAHPDHRDVKMLKKRIERLKESRPHVSP
ncbi:MAG: tetratricopeptide repeat protein [Candidatus Omnitrophota bacterium]